MSIRICWAIQEPKLNENEAALKDLLQTVDTHLKSGGKVEWLQSALMGSQTEGFVLKQFPIVILTAILTEGDEN